MDQRRRDWTYVEQMLYKMFCVCWVLTAYFLSKQSHLFVFVWQYTPRLYRDIFHGPRLTRGVLAVVNRLRWGRRIAREAKGKWSSVIWEWFWTIAVTSDLSGHLLDCTETFHHSSQTVCYGWRDGRERLRGEGQDKRYREEKKGWKGRGEIKGTQEMKTIFMNDFKIYQANLRRLFFLCHQQQHYMSGKGGWTNEWK